MSAVQNRNTKVEMTLRRALQTRGLRYRLKSTLISKPDIVFRPTRVVAFVDGDYWNGNAWRSRGYANFKAYHGRGDNAIFCLLEIRRNIVRDCEVTQALQNDGGIVLGYWGGKIKHHLDHVASRIEAAVGADRGSIAGARA